MSLCFLYSGSKGKCRAVLCFSIQWKQGKIPSCTLLLICIPQDLVKFFQKAAKDLVKFDKLKIKCSPGSRLHVSQVFTGKSAALKVAKDLVKLFKSRAVLCFSYSKSKAKCRAVLCFSYKKSAAC